MGRKKIEIRPLTDERNRNVTFLKRKAGLMKKAWELSVLCGAEVSILIFSNAGKPYEFSSRDVDTEIDRYLEYEGLIERRRGEEFAAMAEAGEDDDDDDEREVKPGMNGQPKPVKSLKGKESFKKRMPSRRDMAKGAKRKRRDESGFIEGLVSSGDEDGPSGSSDSLAYAMNMHSTPLANGYRQPKSELAPSYTTPPYAAAPGSSAGAGLMGGAGGAGAGQAAFPPTMGGLQWDQNLMQRYAEFQLQQNHQRQQRILLERQRAQLAGLGVPMGNEERRILDDIFGVGRQSQSQAQAQTQQHAGSVGSASISGDAGGGGGGGGSGAGMVPSQEEFIWPTFQQGGQASGPAPGQGQGQGGAAQDRYYDAYPNPTQMGEQQWQVQPGVPYSAHGAGAGSTAGGAGVGVGPYAHSDENQFPSPVSYEEEMRRRREDGYAHHAHEKRIRVG